jgi:DNA-binding MarR family transcriptional regulator
VATTTSQAPVSEAAETKAAILAVIDAMTLTEPIQAKLWQVSGITMAQLSVLRQLRNGPETVGKLGAEVGLSPASVTRLVDRLEKRGLVARSRDAEDRRRVDVRLTSQGERVLGESKVFKGSDVHLAVEAMTSDERRAMTASLSRFVELARGFAAAKEEDNR